MRVAQIIDGLRPAGGAERLQQTLVRALEPFGVEVTIVTIGDDEIESVREMEALGVRVVNFPSRRFASLARARRLRRFFAAEKFDVVHTHLVRSTVLGAAAAKSVGTPVVATIHNSKRNPKLSRALLALEVRALRHWVDRVIAVGWETAAAHEGRLGGTTIEVLPNAVATPPPLPEADRRKLREELGAGDDACVCIAVSRLARAKNFPLLLDAFSELVRVAPTARLRIVGEGALRPDIEQRIEALRLGDTVELLGLRRDVDRLLASSDVFVSASDYEGLPLATLEAMHAGLPVVATKVGDVPHVVTPETGRLVDKGDRNGLVRELANLVEDDGLRAALGEAGRVRAAREFGTERWAARHLKIYEAVSGLGGEARARRAADAASCREQERSCES
jgi:glycosyltransferase involved in cell wall biosynthesis